MSEPHAGRRLALATWQGLPGLTADDRLAAEALRERGAAVEPLVWDACGAGAGFDAVIVRSVWDYHRRAVEFLRWVDGLERAGTPLLNPPAVLRWNHHKGYLRDLEARGILTVPTVWIERGSVTDLCELLAAPGFTEAVIKPAISASAHETWAVRTTPSPQDEERLRRLAQENDVLVQPLLPEVQAQGEWSLVFLGGRFSHAMLKRPREGDFRVQEELGGRAEAQPPPEVLVEDARRALAMAPAACAYARVDGIERGGRLLLMELELIEPVLYLGRSPGAAGRFAEACLAALSGSHSGTE